MFQLSLQVVQRSLDSLVESGDVREKVYNKQHVYVFEQVLSLDESLQIIFYHNYYINTISVVFYNHFIV